MSTYALLDVSLTSVIGFNDVDPAVFATLANAKKARYRIVNMIAEPSITATQYVTQNGWTVTANDVQPVWVINTLPVSQQDWNNTLALNIVTAGKNAITNWNAGGTYSAAKDTVLLDLLKVTVALLESKYGISN